MQEGHRPQKLRVTGHIAHHHKWLATFLPYQNPERKKLELHLEEEKNNNVFSMVKLYNVYTMRLSSIQWKEAYTSVKE